MRAVVQRVTEASVTVDGAVVGRIQRGLLVLLGVRTDDTAADLEYTVAKCAHLRVFEADAGKMNRSVLDVGGAVLAVSQFTLYGDVSHGRRPSFIDAARPEQAEPMYEAFCSSLSRLGLHVERGVFGADMKVALVNDGPVTILVDSRAPKR
ncbi:MAG: D-aminoacyl-tRNA deacylase [Armatimonadetes bacterium]|nr:D-aminoacyl-tRNA deacylase [Armatimonadota bacterium]